MNKMKKRNDTEDIVLVKRGTKEDKQRLDEQYIKSLERTVEQIKKDIKAE